MKHRRSFLTALLALAVAPLAKASQKPSEWRAHGRWYRMRYRVLPPYPCK